MWPYLAPCMIRNRLAGNPKTPELKLQGQQFARTFHGSPCQHVRPQCAYLQKGKVSWRPSEVLPALLVCKLVQCPNLMGRKSEKQSRPLRYSRTEQMRTFPCICVQIYGKGSFSPAHTDLMSLLYICLPRPCYQCVLFYRHME